MLEYEIMQFLFKMLNEYNIIYSLLYEQAEFEKHKISSLFSNAAFKINNLCFLRNLRESQ